MVFIILNTLWGDTKCIAFSAKFCSVFFLKIWTMYNEKLNHYQSIYSSSLSTRYSISRFLKPRLAQKAGSAPTTMCHAVIFVPVLITIHIFSLRFAVDPSFRHLYIILWTEPLELYIFCGTSHVKTFTYPTSHINYTVWRYVGSIMFCCCDRWLRNAVISRGRCTVNSRRQWIVWVFYVQRSCENHQRRSERREAHQWRLEKSLWIKPAAVQCGGCVKLRWVQRVFQEAVLQSNFITSSKINRLK